MFLSHHLLWLNDIITVGPGESRTFKNDTSGDIVNNGGTIHVFGNNEDTLTNNSGNTYIFGINDDTITLNEGRLNLAGENNDTINCNGGVALIFGANHDTIRIGPGEYFRTSATVINLYQSSMKMK